MTIKGKSKTRSRRTVASAPKPVHVVPRKPLLARRSVQFGFLGLVVVLIGGILLWVWNGERAEAAREEQQETILEFQSELEAPLGAVRQAVPPSGVQLFADMRTTVAGFREGTVDPSTVLRDAAGWEEVASTARTEIDQIEPSLWVRDRGLDLEWIDAHNYLLRAVSVYHEVAVTLQLAAEAEPGEARDALLEIADRLMGTADNLTQFAYTKINNQRAEAGLGVETTGFAS